MDAIAASILANTSTIASEPVAVVATDILSGEIWIVVRSQCQETLGQPPFWAASDFKFFSGLKVEKGRQYPPKGVLLKFIEKLKPFEGV